MVGDVESVVAAHHHPGEETDQQGPPGQAGLHRHRHHQKHQEPPQVALGHHPVWLESNVRYIVYCEPPDLIRGHGLQLEWRVEMLESESDKLLISLYKNKTAGVGLTNNLILIQHLD